MAEGKKQRKFGRNSRSASGQRQALRTQVNKARKQQKAGDKWMDVKRGSARACRRALTFYGKVYAAILPDVPYSYAEGVVGKKGQKSCATCSPSTGSITVMCLRKRAHGRQCCLHRRKNHGNRKIHR